jgi:hypothetical protein
MRLEHCDGHDISTHLSSAHRRLISSRSALPAAHEGRRNTNALSTGAGGHLTRALSLGGERVFLAGDGSPPEFSFQSWAAEAKTLRCPFQPDHLEQRCTPKSGLHYTTMPGGPQGFVKGRILNSVE